MNLLFFSGFMGDIRYPPFIPQASWGMKVPHWVWAIFYSALIDHSHIFHYVSYYSISTHQQQIYEWTLARKLEPGHITIFGQVTWNMKLVHITIFGQVTRNMKLGHITIFGQVTGNMKLASCPWGPVTANGVGILKEMYEITVLALQAYTN